MKQAIINFLFKRMLNAVTLENVLVTDKTGAMFLGGKPITDDELRQLIAECKALQGFRVWNIMNENLKAEALERGWNKSTSLEQLNVGKTIYYTLDMQNSIIHLIRSREKK